MRTWMLVTEHNSHFGDRETVEMPDYLPVTIYADTTRQFSEDEIEEMQNSEWGQMIEIPVPENLLKQWWYDCLEFDRDHAFNEEPDGGWAECTDEDFHRWFYEESTADDCDTLYDWLVAHNYNWKRLD